MVVDLARYRKARRLLESISFGEWIAIARKNQGLTQAQLGERVGYSQPVISRMETGVLDIWPELAFGQLQQRFEKCLVCNYTGRR